VERTAAQRSLLWQNVGRLAGRAQIQVIDGTAPAALEDLPNPDAVFIGGSGGNLAAILDVATRRISPNGRVVVNLVILERVTEMIAWARAHSIPVEVVQVGVARGTDIVGYTRLQAENPVTVVTLTGGAL
jgi:precorrin-6Y C5,15-methyltransferase (decarboxylating)